MSVEEVQRLAGDRIVNGDHPRSWSTHFIRDGSTDIWLVFKDDRVRSTQLAWMYRLKKMKEAIQHKF